jgi:hypothetical protein
MQQTAILGNMVLGTGTAVPSASAKTVGREDALNLLHELFVQTWCHTTGMRGPTKYWLSFRSLLRFSSKGSTLRGH